MSRRIFFISHTLDFRRGGAERVIHDVLNRIDRARFEPVLVVARDDGEVPEAFGGLGVESRILTPLPMPPKRTMASLISTALALVRLNVALLRLLWREPASALYVNSYFALHFAVIPALIARVPVIYHEHGLARDRRHSPWSRLFPWLLRRVSHTIAITDAVKAQLVEMGLAESAVTTIHNGIEVEGASFRGEQEEGGRGVRTPGVFSIAQIANFLPWKGHETVVRALPRLRERLPGLRVVFFGQSEDPSFDAHLRHLRELISRLGVGDMIEFAGFRTDVLRLLPQFDCLVLASHGEPFGLVLIEAMRAGVPVVASNAGGVPEIVTDGHDGLLFEPGDENGLADQVERLARDAELSERLARTGFKTVRERFSIGAQVRSIERVLEDVVNRGTA